MQKKIKICLGLIVLMGIITTGTPAFAEGDKPTCDMSVTVYSQYIWRGFELSRDSIVIFPEMTVSYKGFGFTICGDLDTDYYLESAQNQNRMELWETDYVLTYSNKFGKLNCTLGLIYYDVDNGEDQEVYVVLGLDTFLSPELSIWRGIEHTDSWYFNLGVSHSFELDNKWSLGVGGWISYYDIPDGDPITGDDYNEFHDGTIWIELSIPLNEWATLTPSINYTFPLSSDADDFFEASSFEGDSDWIYGGIALSISF